MANQTMNSSDSDNPFKAPSSDQPDVVLVSSARMTAIGVVSTIAGVFMMYTTCGGLGLLARNVLTNDGFAVVFHALFWVLPLTSAYFVRRALKSFLVRKFISHDGQAGQLESYSE